HEVGHAVHGQLKLRKPLIITSLILILVVITSCGCLFAAKWVLVLDLFVVLLVSYFHWKDEVCASSFAAKELSDLVGAKVVSSRLALDKLILAMESISIAMAFWSAYSLLYFAMKSVVI
ncbi:MAG: hypothetical protein GX957_12700, partial [Clostridiaceae bacterium]|nr:hypothetical protein [Clostridiaceae bacterium]